MPEQPPLMPEQAPEPEAQTPQAPAQTPKMPPQEPGTPGQTPEPTAGEPAVEGEPTGLDALYPSSPDVNLGTADAPPQAETPPRTVASPQAGVWQQPPPTQPTAPPQQPPIAPPPPTPPAYGYYAPPPVPRRNRGCLIAFIVAIVLVGGGITALVVAGLANSGDLSFGDKIGVISVAGVIHSDTISSPFFGTQSGANLTISQLRQAESDTSVKAVLLRINSPGGSAAASQAMYKAVLRLQQKKPVVVTMGDAAASGGYYVASAAQTVVACPTTLTGSIGVIMPGINYSGLMNKYGVQDQAITTGPYKDTGSPQRPMRPDERILLKAMLLDIYDQFVTDVAAGRRMDVATVRKLADGRVYTGRQAKKYGLVDELGDFYDAAKIAQQKAGLTGEPQLKYYQRTSLISTLLDSQMGRQPSSGMLEQALLMQALQQQAMPATALLLMPGYSAQMEAR
jgi:protease IV